MKKYQSPQGRRPPSKKKGIADVVLEANEKSQDRLREIYKTILRSK